jgi:membrane-bound lytic murein transglycosylase D
VDKASLNLHTSSGSPPPAWLKNLKVPPDLPVQDEPKIRNLYDYFTKNIAGRQGLQEKLFQCSAYADIFESALVKYGAPRWLEAVVYQESACNPLAKSPVGARGLWQFMPEAGRAYGLKVVDGEIDERLNPIKSTEAAMHFLTDLQRKLGSWDLVFAAYNMGPFAILARFARIGEKVGFWDLEHAGLLPDETAGYVPSIEAYALVLSNLARLQFNPYGKRLESTAEVIVKPGMRLSLLARSASTTTGRIRDLNPEFLRDVVPEDVRAARVPDTEVHRAQAFLDAWTPADNRDTCVPPDFDWGAQQFETSKYAKTCKPATGAQ